MVQMGAWNVEVFLPFFFSFLTQIPERRPHNFDKAFTVKQVVPMVENVLHHLRTVAE